MSYKDLKRELRAMNDDAAFTGRDARQCALQATLILGLEAAAAYRSDGSLIRRTTKAREIFASLYNLTPESALDVSELPADPPHEERA